MSAHSHSHGGAGHSHGRAASRKRLAWVLALSGGYMVAEFIGGLATNSLALLADAGHMLSDVAALGLSLFAMWLAERPPTSQRTYGFYRTEILAALVNGATLVAISVFIFVEAYHRFREPPEVQGALMMGIAAGGLAINLTGLWILNAGRGESVNVRGAWLHVATDALGSVGAIIGGALIAFFGWEWADPVVSVAIGLLVVFSSWSLVRETVSVLMESAPGHIDVDEVRASMRSVEGVSSVHDLHVWSITSGLVALSAHITADGRPVAAVIAETRELVHERFGIDHVTLQVEPRGLEEAPTHA